MVAIQLCHSNLKSRSHLLRNVITKPVALIKGERIECITFEFFTKRRFTLILECIMRAHISH